MHIPWYMKRVGMHIPQFWCMHKEQHATNNMRRLRCKGRADCCACTCKIGWIATCITEHIGMQA